MSLLHLSMVGGLLSVLIGMTNYAEIADKPTAEKRLIESVDAAKPTWESKRRLVAMRRLLSGVGKDNLSKSDIEEIRTFARNPEFRKEVTTVLVRRGNIPADVLICWDVDDMKEGVSLGVELVLYHSEIEFDEPWSGCQGK